MKSKYIAVITSLIAISVTIFQVYIQHIDENLTNGDVRYFLPKDKQLAEMVLKDFVNMVCEEGYKLDLQLIPLIQNKDRNIQGMIEVWLSAKSIQKITNSKDNCFWQELKI